MKLLNVDLVKMTRMLILCISLLMLLEDSKAARILAVFPTPSISHQVVFRPLVHELARRGHDVTVVTTDPVYPPGKAPKNLTEINVHDLSYKIWMDEFFKATVEDNDLTDQVSIIIRAAAKITVAQLKTKDVQDIIQKKRGEYDLLLLEAYVQPALIYSHYFKAPVILISSLGAMKFNYMTVGAPTHPLLYPTFLHQKLYNLTYWEKVQQLYKHWCIEDNVWKTEQDANNLLKSEFGPDIPTINELSNNVHMLFINMNPIWVDNQPVPPNVVYIGGIHVTPQKELPKDLQSFLNSSKNGVIYFSLGTNIKTSALPQGVIETFVKVFSQLPYDVLWKLDQEELPGRTENIRISTWLPQSDILRHPNLKLFITQGGLQSTDEAITAGVPLIGIPLLADQWFNVQKYIRHHIGEQLDIESLSVEKLRKAIETVIGDKRYRENILGLGKIMSDQPQSPLERAVWWTEHALRHGGAMHLRAAGANVSWAQYLELELVFIVLLILLLILAAMFTALYMSWKFLVRIKCDKKQKTN